MFLCYFFHLLLTLVLELKFRWESFVVEIDKNYSSLEPYKPTIVF